MTEKAKKRAEIRVEKRREKGISSFVVILIVLSVLAVSVVPVSAPPPEARVTGIVLSANPEGMPADGSSLSNITANVTYENTNFPSGFKITFEITSQPGGADLTKDYDYPDDPPLPTNAYTDLIAGTTPGNVMVIAYWEKGQPEQVVSNLVTVTLFQPPEIVDYAPLESPVKDNEGATRTFNVTVSQTVNVTWQINGTIVKDTEEGVTEAFYTNESAVAGIWNVSAIATNPNGTAMQTWIWKVSELERIEVSPASWELADNETKQFTATAYDQFNEIMSGIIFAWTSSNTTVGEVDQTGFFTAKAPGETFVNATNQSVVGSAHVVVTPGPLARIEVSPSEKTLNMGATWQFEAKGYDAFGNEIAGLSFTWTSSNTTVGAVNGTGFFEALYPGFTLVNATADSVTGTASVTVIYTPVVTSVVVSPPKVTLNITETQQFTATAKDQLGKEMLGVVFTWTSSNTTVGTVDANDGLFTAEYPGETLVNATADSVTGTASVTVIYVPIVDTIMIEPAEATIYEGTTQQFTATAYDQIGKEMPGITDFAWSSSNTTVGTVYPTAGSKTTIFTAHMTGDATVRATAEGLSNTSSVHVLPRPDLVVVGITPNPDCSGYLFANESNELCAVIQNNGSGDAIAFNVSFSADSFSGKASVDSLAVGANTTVCVTDTTERNAGESVTITVIADCDDTIAETNETNNESSIADIIVVNNGYKSKSFAGLPSLVLLEHDKFNGSIVYTVGNSSKVELYPADTTTTGFDITILGGATVRTARLYVYWYHWHNTDDAAFKVTFNGHVFTAPGESYTDRPGPVSSYDYPKGTYAYDVTSDVNGTGTYTATIENTGTGTSKTTGQLLFVVYEDTNGTEMEYWITEGCDLLKGDSNYCVSPEEAIASVTFEGTIDVTNKSARLITVVAQGNEPGTDLSFNEQVWEDVWQVSAGNSKINIDDRSATGLRTSDNVADFRDTGTMGMQASNAILVVETEVKYSVNVTLESGWNMISVPKVPENASVDYILPDRVGSVWMWDGEKYVSASTLEPKKGYWVAMSESKQVNFTGTHPQNTTLYLNAGWNMIGLPVQYNVSTDVFGPNRVGSVWTWDGIKYVSVSTLEPKKGYWVAMSENTQITIGGE